MYRNDWRINFPIFIFRVMVIFVLKTANFRWIFMRIFQWSIADLWIIDPFISDGSLIIHWCIMYACITDAFITDPYISDPCITDPGICDAWISDACITAKAYAWLLEVGWLPCQTGTFVTCRRRDSRASHHNGRLILTIFWTIFSWCSHWVSGAFNWVPLCREAVNRWFLINDFVVEITVWPPIKLEKISHWLSERLASLGIMEVKN